MTSLECWIMLLRHWNDLRERYAFHMRTSRQTWSALAALSNSPLGLISIWRFPTPLSTRVVSSVPDIITPYTYTWVVPTPRWQVCRVSESLCNRVHGDIHIFYTPEQSQRCDHRYEKCQKGYVIGCMVSYIYCHTQYTWAVPTPRWQVCRVSESLCNLLHGVICIFPHPIHLSRPNASITGV